MMQTTVLARARTAVVAAAKKCGCGQGQGRRGMRTAPAVLRAASEDKGDMVMKGQGQMPGHLRRGQGLGRMSRDMLSPYRLMQDFEQEIDDMMKGFGLTHLNRAPLMKGDMSLAVDVVENKDNFVIHADTPGMKAADIKIEVSPDHLMTISGERKNEMKSDENGVVRVERSYGTFVRSFKLPDHVDIHGIKADVAHGVLKLTVPKMEEEHEEPKVINISVNNADEE